MRRERLRQFYLALGIGFVADGLAHVLGVAWRAYLRFWNRVLPDQPGISLRFMGHRYVIDPRAGALSLVRSWGGVFLDYGGAAFNLKHPAFGLAYDGTTDDTAGVLLAITAVTTGTAPKKIFQPVGTILISGKLDGLNIAGFNWEAESKWKSVIKLDPTFADAYVFGNPGAASATSAFVRISGVKFELNGIDAIAVDLSSVNNSVVEDCYAEGGTNLATATGTLVKFGAPLSSGAYLNTVQRCHGRYLATGIEWGEGANLNSARDIDIITSILAFDCAPGGTGVGNPRIDHARAEGCTTGLKEGALRGYYTNIWFESNTVDIDWIAGSTEARIVGGSTATAGTVHQNIANAVDCDIQSSDLSGYRRIETSESRPMQIQGYILRSAPGATVPSKPSPMTGVSYCEYFDARTLMRNNVRHYGLNAAADAVRELIGVNSSDVVVVGGGSSVTEVNSSGAFRPANNGSMDLGATTRYFGRAYLTSVRWAQGTTGIFDLVVSGTPEGASSADVGSTARRSNGGAGTSFYVKESGTGNTGWAAK